MHEGQTGDRDPGGSVPVRLLLVEDHAALGEALLFAFSFEEGIETVGVAPSIERALEMVATERPDVVLMDVRLPDGSGLDAAAKVAALRPGTAVLIMTANADHLVALQAAESGAAGFLLKDVRIAKIVNGVWQVMAGELAIDPGVLQALLTQAAIDGSGAFSPGDLTPGLSAPEHDVVVLVAEGLDRGAIADRLGLDEHEVARVTAAVRDRLGARSNLEAVVRAARAGLLGGPDQGSRARISNR